MATKEKKTTTISYVKGNATRPVGDGVKVIVHICNNIGAWGAGFVLALSKRWLQPEKQYKAKRTYVLGSYDLIHVEDDIIICNLIGQDGIKKDKYGLPPVRYVAIETALKELAKKLNSVDVNISIHMPKIGSGLAGGNWKIIERIIEVTLCAKGIPVTVYELD